MVYDVSNMLRINSLDISWLRQLANSIDKIDQESIRWTIISSLIFNMGQFARLNSKRLFDSTVEQKQSPDTFLEECKLLFEKIISSEIIKKMASGTFTIDVFNQFMSGLFSLETLGYKVDCLGHFMDLYVERIGEQDFSLVKKTIPMSCFIVSNIYNRRYTETDLPVPISEFLEQVRYILQHEPLTLSPESRAQMHSLIVTMDTGADETYAEWLKSDMFGLVQTINAEKMLFVQRLVSLLSPDLISSNLITGFVNATLPMIDKGQTPQYIGKARRSIDDLKERKIIEGIYGCWSLTLLDGLSQIPNSKLTPFLSDAIDLSCKYEKNEVLAQSLTHVLIYTKAYKLQ